MLTKDPEDIIKERKRIFESVIGFVPYKKLKISSALAAGSCRKTRCWMFTCCCIDCLRASCDSPATNLLLNEGSSLKTAFPSSYKFFTLYYICNKLNGWSAFIGTDFFIHFKFIQWFFLETIYNVRNNVLYTYFCDLYLKFSLPTKFLTF